MAAFIVRDLRPGHPITHLLWITWDDTEQRAEMIALLNGKEPRAACSQNPDPPADRPAAG